MSESSTQLTYDFVSTLIALDPYHTYTTVPLSGGLVNLTVRVHIFSPTEAHECIFKGVETAVAKYAPAFVASVGDSAPFSQYRQVIEARALALLSQPSQGAYIQPTATTPKLIHHDPASNILLMSDLGDLSTLDRWLCSESITIEAAQNAGTQFGEFLARLSGISEHINQGGAPYLCLGSRTDTRNQGENQEPLDLATHFANPSIHSLLQSVVVLPFESNLIKCGVSEIEAPPLAKVILEMHERQQQAGRSKVFGLGDCWPKSVLIGGRGELNVIDWEFAGMIEPLADLAQLCANIFVLYHASPAPARPKIRSYTLAMLRAHHTYSQLSSAWHYAPEHRVDAWRLFGREVVNNALEASWWNGDEERKKAEMGPLGKMGVEFLKHAEDRGEKEGMLFGQAFEELQ